MRLNEINPDISRKMMMARLWILEGILEDSFQKPEDLGASFFNSSSDDVEFKGEAFISEVFFALSLPSLSCQWWHRGQWGSGLDRCIQSCSRGDIETKSGITS